MIYIVGDEEETKNQKGVMGRKERICGNDKTSSKPRHPRKIGGGGGVGRPAGIALGRNKLGCVITYVFPATNRVVVSKQRVRCVTLGIAYGR